MSTFAVTLTIEFEAVTHEDAACLMSTELEHEDFDPRLCNYEVRRLEAPMQRLTGNGDPV
jgi:hypothetical protein